MTRFLTHRRVLGIGVILALSMLYIGLLQVSTAANTVPSTRAGVSVLRADPDQMRPTQCNSLHLTAIIRGAGSFSGSKNNDLILGGPGNDDINGGKGDDCIIGGSGTDKIDGGGGNDICIGGSGTDTFTSCAVVVQ
ncbi:MAG: hypothetical protein ABI577_16080 [bacterium]